MQRQGITALYSRPQIIEFFKNDLKLLNINTTNKKLEEIFDLVSINFYKDMTKYTKPINGAIEFIKKVKELGLKTGVVTSDAKESTDITLKNFGWEKYFDVVIGRESSPHSKESGKPTILALDSINASPQSTVMIGDAPMDYISAQNAGIKNTILVATGQISKKELEKTSPFVTKSLKNIIIIS